MQNFSARVSLETANLLAFMSDYYQQQRGVSFSKADTLTAAYQDASWVMPGDWAAIRDYALPELKQFDLKPSAIKIQIPLETQIQKELDDLNVQIRQELGANILKRGTQISYLLKAAYIKYFDAEMMPKKMVVPTVDAHALDSLIDQYTQAILAMTAPGRQATVEMLMKQLKIELRNLTIKS
ncbi:hypothetical protein [Lacticaseibacillus parakribbianus]|uniref:hypothetical protein n=1 Tax=Lacticaseibacillus parakribbianus TaxID=2970927 RepID=UPI0021CB68E5|nr:hypothetical protein [Lacticaseibacillus parakribbianus]